MRNTLPTQKQDTAAGWNLAELNGCSSVANQPSVDKSAVGTTVEHHGRFLKTQTWKLDVNYVNSSMCALSYDTGWATE